MTNHTDGESQAQENTDETNLVQRIDTLHNCGCVTQCDKTPKLQ